MRYIDLEFLINGKKARWPKYSSALWKEGVVQEDFRSFGYNKCWYTESDDAGANLAIDHFRPKKEVKPYPKYSKDLEYNNEIEDTGYDWLMNNPWNYRVSCHRSNSPNGSRNGYEKRIGGKRNYFPLEKGSYHLKKMDNIDETNYIRGKSNIAQEEKYIFLDPCNKEDVEKIRFEEGKIVCNSLDPKDELRVKVSIESYNLDDPEMELLRKRLWQEVCKILEIYRDQNITLDVCVDLLELLIKRDTPYSACAISCIKSFDTPEIIVALGDKLEL